MAIEYRTDASMVVLNKIQDLGALSVSRLPVDAGKLLPKVNARKGMDGGCVEWNRSLRDLLARYRIVEYLDRPEPTISMIASLFPCEGEAKLHEIWQQARAEWWSISTELFWVMRPSVDLSGPHAETDAVMIDERFTAGSARDGHALYQWVVGFADVNAEEYQSKLRAQASTVLGKDANYDQFVKHLHSVFHAWRKIKTNDVTNNAAFYQTLLDSLPTPVKHGVTPGSMMFQLRNWLADKVTERSPSLCGPVTDFLEYYAEYARRLGMPREGMLVNPLVDPNGDGGKKSDRMRPGNVKCGKCNSFVCPAIGNEPKKCVVMSNQKKPPAGTTWTTSQANYIKIMQQYVAAKPECTSVKNVSLKTVREVLGIPPPEPRGKQQGGQNAKPGGADDEVVASIGAGSSPAMTLGETAAARGLPVPLPKPLGETGLRICDLTQEQFDAFMSELDSAEALANFEHDDDAAPASAAATASQVPPTQVTFAPTQVLPIFAPDSAGSLNLIAMHAVCRPGSPSKANLLSPVLEEVDEAAECHAVVDAAFATDVPLCSSVSSATEAVQSDGLPKYDNPVATCDTATEAYDPNDEYWPAWVIERTTTPEPESSAPPLSRAEVLEWWGNKGDDAFMDDDDSCDAADAQLLLDQLGKAKVVSMISDAAAPNVTTRDSGPPPTPATGHTFRSVPATPMAGRNLLDALYTTPQAPPPTPAAQPAPSPSTPSATSKGKKTAPELFAEAMARYEADMRRLRESLESGFGPFLKRLLRGTASRTLLVLQSLPQHLTYHNATVTLPRACLAAYLINLAAPHATQLCQNSPLLRQANGTAQQLIHKSLLTVALILRHLLRAATTVLKAGVVAVTGTAASLAGIQVSVRRIDSDPAAEAADAVANAVASQWHGMFAVPGISAEAAMAVFQDDMALNDSGASIHCINGDLGRIHSTYCSSQMSLQVGDKKAGLNSRGTCKHAFTLVSMDGDERDICYTFHDTPQGLGIILSEGLMCTEDKQKLEQDHLNPRQLTDKTTGQVMRMIMSPNGLGWYRVKPITDPKRMRDVLLAAGLNDSVVRDALAVHCTSLVSSPLLMVTSAPRPGINMSSRYVNESPIEAVRRLHCVMGHASVRAMAHWLSKQAGGLVKLITREALIQFANEGCIICDQTKMNRAFFGSQPKPTVCPEVGKKWTFDSLSLRIPSKQYGYRNITSFVDATSKLQRSYGHITMSEADLEAQCQKLRAFVRPYHGEILILKHDGHPSLTGHAFEEFETEEGIRDQKSPPYVHEGIGEGEVIFRHRVPTANALLRGSSSKRVDESHIYTAFLYAEDAYNDTKVDGRCPNEVFGRPSASFDAAVPYGTPCMFLVHPEVRGSKFNDHALPGTYRGRSREDESLHRGLVYDGHRHVTIDMGCARFDSRQVVARSSRNNSNIQPFTLSPDPPPPALNFSKWTVPTKASAAVWGAADPVPNARFAVYLGAGKFATAEGSIADWNVKLTGHATVNIDKHIGGYGHDWTTESVYNGLAALLDSPNLTFIVATPDCSPYSPLRLRPIAVTDSFGKQVPGGPAPLFTKAEPNGVCDSSGNVKGEALKARMATDRLFSLLTAPAKRGVPVIVESPVDYGAESPFAIPALARHSAVWGTDAAVQYRAETASEFVYGDRCMEGCEIRKSTAFLCSPPLLHDADPATSLGKNLLKCNHISHPKQDMLAPDGNFTSAQYARLEPSLCGKLVRAAIAATPATAAKTPSCPDTDGGDTDDAYVPFAEEPPEPELTAAQARPRRPQTEARYTVDGELIQHVDGDDRAATIHSQVIDELVLNHLGQHVGHTQDYTIETEGVAFHVSTPLVDGDKVADAFRADGTGVFTMPAGTHDSDNFGSQFAKAARAGHDVIGVEGYVIDISDGTLYKDTHYFAVANGHWVCSVAVRASEDESHDTSRWQKWHVPTNEREYKLSPQRALWRTARELKMDEYISINMFTLVKVKDVRAAGHEIYNTVWAQTIKSDGAGNFGKLNPRWCLVGTSMDRSIYESYSDVVRFSSVKLIACVRSAYPVIDFHIDLSNAFQNTRTDDDPSLPKLFCRCAPGFEQYDADGDQLCCQLNVGMQGRIDACRIFTKRFERTVADNADMQRCLWDPKVYVYHEGALAGTAASLDDVIREAQSDAAAAAQAALSPGARPIGWLVMGVHVDDSMGVATSQRCIDYLQGVIANTWACTATGWKKVLGYTVDVVPYPDGRARVSLSCKPALETAVRKYFGDSPKFSPKHPYSAAGLKNMAPGVRPAPGSVQRDEFDKMQADCRSLLGLMIWVSMVYPQITYATNEYCGYMSNPNHEVFKNAKLTLLHAHHNPVPVTYGAPDCRSLLLSTPLVVPFATDAKEYGLHFFVDAALGATGEAPSKTGGVIMCGGGAIDTISIRQHLKSPDSTVSEVVAAGTMMHRVMPVRGLAHELRITQSLGTPGFIDSSSTVFIARDQAAPKRSIWILRRSAVLQESKDQGDIDPLKIDERDNVADDQTKPVSHATFVRHLKYTHNVLDSPDVPSPPPSPPDSKHGSPAASDMSDDEVIDGGVLDAYDIASDDDDDVEDFDEWGPEVEVPWLSKDMYSEVVGGIALDVLQARADAEAAEPDLAQIRELGLTDTELDELRDGHNTYHRHVMLVGSGTMHSSLLTDVVRCVMDMSSGLMEAFA